MFQNWISFYFWNLLVQRWKTLRLQSVKLRCDCWSVRIRLRRDEKERNEVQEEVSDYEQRENKYMMWVLGYYSKNQLGKHIFRIH